MPVPTSLSYPRSWRRPQTSMTDVNSKKKLHSDNPPNFPVRPDFWDVTSQQSYIGGHLNGGCLRIPLLRVW
jgi:hypothetical protein